MEIEEAKKKKKELNDKISALLSGFEEETGVQVSNVDFVRRVFYDELGREIEKKYVVDVYVKL